MRFLLETITGHVPGAVAEMTSIDALRALAGGMSGFLTVPTERRRFDGTVAREVGLLAVEADRSATGTAADGVAELLAVMADGDFLGAIAGGVAELATVMACGRGLGAFAPGMAGALTVVANGSRLVGGHSFADPEHVLLAVQMHEVIGLAERLDLAGGAVERRGKERARLVVLQVGRHGRGETHNWRGV